MKIADRKANLKQENYNYDEIFNITSLIYDELIIKETPFSIKNLKINGVDVMEILHLKPSKK